LRPLLPNLNLRLGALGVGEELRELLLRNGLLLIETLVPLLPSGVFRLGARIGEIGSRAAQVVFVRTAVQGDEQVAGATSAPSLKWICASTPSTCDLIVTVRNDCTAPIASCVMGTVCVVACPICTGIAPGPGRRRPAAAAAGGKNATPRGPEPLRAGARRFDQQPGVPDDVHVET